MKKAYNDYVRNNTRYTDFSEGKESSPPVSQYDEDGVRVMPPYAESEIGDIEVKESRYNTISLLQQFCMGITKIVEFFNPKHPLVMPESEGGDGSSSGELFFRFEKKMDENEVTS